MHLRARILACQILRKTGDDNNRVGDVAAMDAHELRDWITTGTSALSLIRLAATFLPESEDKSDAEAKLREAESLLAESNAALAKKLGYRLCRCTFPPQIMLWAEVERADICPCCGRRHAAPKQAANAKTASGWIWEFSGHVGFPLNLRLMLHLVLRATL